MNQDIKKRWLAALRSGEYKQGVKRLRNNGDEFCCLGVLCDLHAKETGSKWTRATFMSDAYHYLTSHALLPVDVCEWAGIPPEMPLGEKQAAAGRVEINKHTTTLSYLNDNGKTFDEIAQIIEEQF